MKPQRTPVRVLLTDDDEGDRLVFQEIFDDMDADTRVCMAGDCKQMLEVLSNPETPLPHIIFLDLNLPIINGIECLKEIRRQKEYNDISIAIYSTSRSEKDIDDAFCYGANIYITKPGNYDELKQVLIKSLAAVRLSRESKFDRENFVLKI